jgi:hypothetical protein
VRASACLFNTIIILCGFVVSPVEPVTARDNSSDDLVSACCDNLRMNGVTLCANDLSQNPGLEQRGDKSGVMSSHSYVRLTIRVWWRRGEVEIIKLAEVPGTLPLREVLTSNLIYEIKDGCRPLAVGSVPDKSRGYPDPNDEKRHKTIRPESAQVDIDIPDMNLTTIKDSKLSLRIYKLNLTEIIAKINKTIFSQLRDEGRLELEFDYPANKFESSMKTFIANRAKP